jgi:hypothetical protein
MGSVILAWAGGTEVCHSQDTINYMKNLGFSEFHYVSADLNPRKDICDRLHANGIFAVYDVEGKLWAGQYDSNPLTAEEIAQLKAIKAAGWDGFSSEGMFGPQIEVIRQIGPYVNYGGENGESMIGGYYNHQFGQHTANYMEAYHKSALGHSHLDEPTAPSAPVYELPFKTYKSTLLVNQKDTPKEMGLTWMLYPATADLEMDTTAMKGFLDWGEQQGVKWKVFLFWMGIVHCARDKIQDGTFIPLLNMVKGKFSIMKRTAWNQGENLMATTTGLSASPAGAVVGEKVVFGATLKAGTTALAGKPVTIYHMFEGVRYNDVTANTDATGGVMFTQVFNTAGVRTYYASFAGDSTYATSTSAAVSVTITGSKPVDSVLTMSTGIEHPLVGELVTFVMTLKAGTTALANKPIKVAHSFGDWTGVDATVMTNSAGTATYTQTFYSPGVRTFSARFEGDASYAASTSAAVFVTVSNPVVVNTVLSITASNTNPFVGDLVDVTVKLVDAGGKLLANKSVKIEHELCSEVYVDATKITDANGLAKISQAFGSRGLRTYFAKFAGDSAYNPSATKELEIVVHKKV